MYDSKTKFIISNLKAVLKNCNWIQLIQSTKGIFHEPKCFYIRLLFENIYRVYGSIHQEVSNYKRFSMEKQNNFRRKYRKQKQQPRKYYHLIK